MELSDNLKRIRKDNNLSQEQLAEKLGVSRQAVSKWESGQSYPEMDKMLMICKMFNYNIDELLTGNVKEVEDTKQSKINYNKYIEDFFAYVTKTINCVSSMTFKQKIGCLFEQFIIVVCFIIIVTIIGGLGSGILHSITSIFGGLTYDVFEPIYYLFRSIYLLLATLLGIVIVLHTFKVRYLNYFVEVNEDKKEVTDDASSDVIQNNNEESVKGSRTIFGKKQKIIYRDPDTAGSKILGAFIKALLFAVKCFVVSIAFWFMLSFVFFAACLVLSFMIVKSGVLFIGVFLGLIAALVINFICLHIMFNFITNKKNKKEAMGITFLISLLVGGIASGLVVTGISQFNFIEDDNQYTKTDEFIVEMNDALIIDSYNYANDEESKYVETDSPEIKIVVNHSDYTTPTKYESPINRIHISCYPEGNQNMNMFRQYIKDIANKEIKDYSNYTLTIYASKENIEKLKNNYAETESLNDRISNLNNQVNKLTSENEELNNKIKSQEMDIKELSDQLKENDTLVEDTSVANEIVNTVN